MHYKLFRPHKTKLPLKLPYDRLLTWTWHQGYIKSAPPNFTENNEGKMASLIRFIQILSWLAQLAKTKQNKTKKLTAVFL